MTYSYTRRYRLSPNPVTYCTFPLLNLHPFVSCYALTVASHLSTIKTVSTLRLHASQFPNNKSEVLCVSFSNSRPLAKNNSTNIN